MSEEKSYIGKYVCYDREDGGACWGRIKDEAIVIKRHPETGKMVEKEVFILENRYVRYYRTKDLKNFRTFYPNASVGNFSNPQYGKASGNSFAGAMDCGDDEVFLETKKVTGDSTLHKDQIDLERDIVDLDDVLGMVDDEVLFKAILGAKGETVDGKTAMEIGLNALLKDEACSAEAAKVLKRRIGIDI